MKNITKNKNYYKAMVMKAQYDLENAVDRLDDAETMDLKDVQACIAAQKEWQSVLAAFEDLEAWAAGSLTEAELNRVHSVILSADYEPGTSLIDTVKEIRLTRWQQALTQYLQKSIAAGEREAEDMDTQFAIDTVMRLNEDDLMYDLCDQPDTKTDTLEDQISTWEEQARYQAKWAMKKKSHRAEEPERWECE
jgi:hypothetical protein